jgi:hypothetical protein
MPPGNGGCEGQSGEKFEMKTTALLPRLLINKSADQLDILKKRSIVLVSFAFASCLYGQNGPQPINMTK